MIILGIDHGTRRVGLALSDETETLARELGIVEAESFFSQLPKIIQANKVEKIVLGLPLSMEGTDTQQTGVVREFKQKLEQATGLEVQVSDERLSSEMAGNLPGGKTEVDSLAAQIILQNYLDKNKNK